MELLRNIIKRTALFRLLKARRIEKQLASWTAHDNEMLEFYKQFVRTGDVCFDVGANVGNRVKIFLKIGARVVAVEPQQACVKTLNRVFGGNPSLTIVPAALGESAGKAEMLISDADTLSSISPDWIAAVKTSGRFANQRWNKTQTVPLTTLDTLVGQFGKPAFVKIDVEGFELQVIKGLSQPIKTISFEFVPEVIHLAFDCIKHLQQIGDIRLNYSIEEDMRLSLDDWISPKEMIDKLSALKDRYDIFGDVYVQFLNV